jgi:putative heme iron utilization protein
MSDKSGPIRPTDEAARELARELLSDARHAALGTIHAGTGAPHVTRIAFGLDGMGNALTLVSDLATHSRGMRADPRASIMIGEPGPRGDPLIHPRLTLQTRAQFISHEDPVHRSLRRVWLTDHPKSQLYVDFADFHFVVLQVESADLNAGFGKAFHLLREDLRL